MKKKIFLVVLLILGIIAGLFLFFFKKSIKPPRLEISGLTTAGIHQVVSANNQFTLDLYNNLKLKEKTNIFYSPYSIFSALAMVYEGASGKTFDEMKVVFHFPQSDILRPNFAAIYNQLNQQAKDFELKTANALWLQKNYPFLSAYLKLVEKYYGGKARNLDFVNETEKSRQVINQYIEEETNKKIKDLIPEGSISPMTMAVLTNAIYFKGVWLWQFNEENTTKQNFFIRPDFSVDVPMMNMSPGKAEFNYFEDEEVQILELPYKGEKVSMVVLLPKKDFSSFDSSLTLDNLKEYQAKMEKTKLDSIALPKFKLETKYFLNDSLSALGMPTAFSDKADFSKMTGRRDLFINFVIHQAFVEVDEKGTEATAATAVMIWETAVRQLKIFRADHPFLFYILDKETGTILFFGRLVDPRG